MNSETKLDLNKFACKLLVRSDKILNEVEDDKILYGHKLTTIRVLKEIANAILDTIDETPPRQ